MRLAWKRMRPIATAITLVAATACQGQCLRSRTRPSAEDNGLAAPSSAQFASEPIPYCRETRLSRPSGTVHVLVDASGSMVGLKVAVPGIVRWIEHAVSGLKGTALDVTQERTCKFNKALGIFGCSSRISIRDYVPEHSTNLHEAVRAASQSDLTFILTDGVAATGPGGAGDCASGVDAACVARALTEFIHPEAGDPGGDPGLWMIPLVAAYNGRFYTEEPIAPTEFDPTQTIQRIRFDFGVEDMNVSVTDPKQGSDGSLSFAYGGPKALLLIVMARRAEVGRDALASLWGQMPSQGVARLGEMKQFSSGLGGLQPVEVYPGYLRRVRFERLEPSDVRGHHSGTLDAEFKPGDPLGTLSLECPASGSGQGTYFLKGHLEGSEEGHGCVPILMMPPHAFRLQAARSQDEDDLQKLVVADRREADAATLRLRLACDGAKRRECEAAAFPVRWIALMDYRKAADGLAQEKAESPAPRLVQSTSTLQPSREPHRIFGFSSILAAFYSATAADQRRIAVTEFSVCGGSRQ